MLPLATVECSDNGAKFCVSLLQAYGWLSPHYFLFTWYLVVLQLASTWLLRTHPASKRSAATSFVIEAYLAVSKHAQCCPVSFVLAPSHEHDNTAVGVYLAAADPPSELTAPQRRSRCMKSAELQLSLTTATRQAPMHTLP